MIFSLDTMITITIAAAFIEALACWRIYYLIGKRRIDKQLRSMGVETE